MGNESESEAHKVHPGGMFKSNRLMLRRDIWVGSKRNLGI